MSGPGPTDSNGREGASGRERHTEVQVLSEVVRCLLLHPSTLRDLDPIASAVLTRGASASVILIRSETRDALTVEAAAGLDALDARGAFLDAARRLTGWITVSRESLLVDDYASDPRFDHGAPLEGAMAAVPLVVYGEVIGALIAFRRHTPPKRVPFDSRDLSFLGVLADISALGLQNIRLADRTAKLEKKTKSLQSEMARREAAATLGEMTGTLMAEIRQPVAAISGFARRVVRALPQGDLNREYLDVIIAETERLDRLITEHLEIAPILKSHFRMEDLNGVVEATLRALKEQIIARKIRCLNRLATGLPRLLLDAEKVEIMIRNIVSDLLGSMPPGGRLKMESKRAGETVHLLIAADGPKNPGDVLERLFVPFRGQKSGPALAVTHQIVKEHGGEIAVRSDPEWPVIFTISFPIKANEDRRKSTDRRKTPRDRRGRGQGRAA